MPVVVGVGAVHENWAVPLATVARKLVGAPGGSFRTSSAKSLFTTRDGPSVRSTAAALTVMGVPAATAVADEQLAAHRRLLWISVKVPALFDVNATYVLFGGPGIV